VWFDPRGLASAVFALLIVERIAHGLADQILYSAINAVWIRALLHRMNAAPLARWSGNKSLQMQACLETQDSEGSARPFITKTRLLTNLQIICNL
jgi:hypothetical protein